MQKTVHYKYMPVFHLTKKQSEKKTTMSNLLYYVAVILIIMWAIGFFAYHSTGIIHILLVIALIAVILRVIRGGNSKI